MKRSKRIRFWLHEQVSELVVRLFGAKELFRYQCFCGASIIKEIPKPMNGGAFARGGSFDISPKQGTVVRVDCIFCSRTYELVWNATKKHFTIAQDSIDNQPEGQTFTVKEISGGIIAEGVSMMSAKKYQQAYEGSTIEQN